jgi:ferrochelatase
VTPRPQAAPGDALLHLSFGGPEGPDDVLPFLENVTRGRGVPPDRLREVAAHYLHFGGVSPINGQNRALLSALGDLLRREGPDLPLYWGNRNWHPLLADTLARMRDEGRRHAAAFVTSAFSSFSGCRQYLLDIERARAAAGPGAPEVRKLRVYFNHPGFIEAVAERTAAALDRLPAPQRAQAALLYTAHSIPAAMSDACDYLPQLREACALVSQRLGRAFGPGGDALVFQSRSGPPSVPWLEPDVLDAIRAHVARADGRALVLAPIGFVSDHMEVAYDLDTEAADLCRERDVRMERAGTAGTHPAFVGMIRDLVLEAIDPQRPRRALGSLGPRRDPCEPGCCPPPSPPRARPAG